MKNLIEPHGWKLVNRMCEGRVREYLLDRIHSMERICLSNREVSDLEMISIGAFSPLEGFVGEDDYLSVLRNNRLKDGCPWTIPITLAVSKENEGRFAIDKDIALCDRGGKILGILYLEEKYNRDKEKEAEIVYGTTDVAHPGVASLYESGDLLLAGKVAMINRPDHGELTDVLLDPKETRLLFYYKGWRSVVAFQTRNPIHRAHEYIQKCALEVVDGLLVHPLVGPTKEDDTPARVRIDCCRALLKKYYPRDRTVLSVFPACMRYAGPKEAILHAIARKNYGCTHFIVGRDHAGVGNYYGTYDAQKIFDEFEPEEIGITPLRFEHAFYCSECDGMATSKTCPHGQKSHIFLSGAKLREMLAVGEMPPPEFTRPEVAAVLIKWWQSMDQDKSDDGMSLVQKATEIAEKKKRVLVIGWDCAPPELVFDEFLDDMPNIKRLMENGIYSELESTIPAITCPAWMSMMTSKNPGKLGFYGFRNRPDYSYDGMSIANSTMVKEDTVWDILSRVGKRSVIIGVPQTYPPKNINGCMITSFLTPSTGSQYTYPPELKSEVESVADGYMLDVDNFRTEDKDQLLEEIYEMTAKRFTVAEHLMKTREWNFFTIVEMGPDRLHHGFWKFFDKSHRKYQPSKYENAARDYYRYLDELAGKLISIAGDEATVIVVSDHGAKRMEGGICINEWLMQEGYLKLKEYPETLTPLRDVEVDWGNTMAWGEGGYYARVFLNMRDREPEGVVPSVDYEKARDELAHKLEALGDENGKPIGTRVFKPQDIYPVCNGIPPDLIVYFGDLCWRSVGSVGLKSVHTFENDTGPDDANHSQRGIFIMHNSRGKRNGRLERAHIMDCAPTILSLLDVPVPDDMEGKVIES